MYPSTDSPVHPAEFATSAESITTRTRHQATSGTLRLRPVRAKRTAPAARPPAPRCTECHADAKAVTLGTDTVRLCPDCLLFHVVKAVGLTATAALVDDLRTFEQHRASPPTHGTAAPVVTFDPARYGDLERVVREYTMAPTFADLCGPLGSAYFPSLRTETGFRGIKGSAADLTRLADAYDAFQAARGDRRRAYRS